MKAFVTGSAGHLGEALCRTLIQQGHEVIGVDILSSPFTTHQGSIADASFVDSCLKGVDVVFHAATLHKPHVGTHSDQEFIDTNLTGTLNCLQAAFRSGVNGFIFTSTTSVFGDALIPPPGEPAAWITEDVIPIPKNIYGVTKAAAEDLCQLYYRNHGLACVVLRTSRFFPEEDDHKEMRELYSGDNLKVNEYLSRRVDLEDVVSAHLLAAKHVRSLGFEKYIISATTPFCIRDLAAIRSNTPQVISQLFPQFEEVYGRLGWKMLPGIDRVYVNDRARVDLDWEPTYDFRYFLRLLASADALKPDIRSPMAKLVGSKGYHPEKFADGPFPLR